MTIKIVELCETVASRTQFLSKSKIGCCVLIVRIGCHNIILNYALFCKKKQNKQFSFMLK